MFEIIDFYDGDFEVSVRTKHSKERTDREKLAIQLCKRENARIIDAFVVDKGHKSGYEIHWILSNGVIVIVNKHSLRFITLLIGRPGQIYRYYHEIGEYPPRFVMSMARKHQKKGYNHI